MTLDEIKNTLPINEYGNVYMELFDCEIPPEDFLARFKGAELACASLSAHVNATPGWIQQFEKWRDDGIIPA